MVVPDLHEISGFAIAIRRNLQSQSANRPSAFAFGRGATNSAWGKTPSTALTRCYLLAEKAGTVDEEQHHHLQLEAQLPVATPSLLCLSFVLAARFRHWVQLLLPPLPPLPLRTDRRLFGQP